MPKKLGEILVDMMVITPEQLQQALEIQKRKGGKLGEILIELGLVNEKIIADAVSMQRKIKRINLDINKIDPEILNLIPKDVCIKYRVLPYAIENNALLVAMDDPLNQEAIAVAQFSANMRVEPGIVEPSKLDEALARLSNAEEISPSQLESTYTQQVDAAEAPPQAASERDSVLRLLNMVLIKGIEFKASDIHIENDEKYTKIRYRIDDVLHEKFKIPAKYHDKIIAQIKRLAKLNDSDRETPQSGGFRANYGGNSIVIKVRIFPTVRGENAVMHLNHKKGDLTSLETLGLNRPELQIITDHIFKPSGLVLVCGPRKSGKTTTIYAILRRINSPDKKIITLENPVEEQLPVINQIEINPASGMNLFDALNFALDLDPDVIFIDEISTQKVAEIAVDAALNGHLVISTMNTCNTFDTIYRLIDFGIEPFLLVNTVQLIIAQRLVRTLCPYCKIKAESAGTVIYRPRGCEKCNNTGYIGRTGVFELMPGDFITRENIIPLPKIEDLVARARKAGIETLWQKGLKKVYAGETSFSEIVRAIPKMRWDENVAVAI